MKMKINTNTTETITESITENIGKLTILTYQLLFACLMFMLVIWLAYRWAYKAVQPDSENGQNEADSPPTYESLMLESSNSACKK